MKGKAAARSKAHSGRETLVGYRLACFDVDPAKRDLRYVGRLYGTGTDELSLIRETIAEFNDIAATREGFNKCIAVFPVFT